MRYLISACLFVALLGCGGESGSAAPPPESKTPPVIGPVGAEVNSPPSDDATTDHDKLELIPEPKGPFLPRQEQITLRYHASDLPGLPSESHRREQERLNEYLHDGWRVVTRDVSEAKHGEIVETILLEADEKVVERIERRLVADLNAELKPKIRRAKELEKSGLSPEEAAKRAWAESRDGQ